MKKSKELDRKYISGIQQIGIGVSNFGEAWKNEPLIRQLSRDLEILKPPKATEWNDLLKF